jgi:hypothetical protein
MLSRSPPPCPVAGGPGASAANAGKESSREEIVVHSRPSGVNDPIRILELSGLHSRPSTTKTMGARWHGCLRLSRCSLTVLSSQLLASTPFGCHCPSRTEVEYEEQSGAEPSALKGCSQPCVKV